MFIYLGHREDDSTKASLQTIKAISEKLIEVLKPKDGKTLN